MQFKPDSSGSALFGQRTRLECLVLWIRMKSMLGLYTLGSRCNKLQIEDSRGVGEVFPANMAKRQWKTKTVAYIVRLHRSHVCCSCAPVW